MRSGEVGKAFFELLLMGNESYDESYENGPFKILVRRGLPPMYLPRVEFEDARDISKLREVCNRVKIGDLNLNPWEIEFERVFQKIKERILDEMCSGEFLGDLRRYAELGAYEVLKLTRIAPFLLDRGVEEFFIDGWNSNVYLTHSSFGRMDSDVFLTRSEIEALMTHLQVYSGRDVSELRTNLKIELKTNDFHVRVNLDVEPLTVDGPVFSVRNLRKKYFTITELIRNGTLSLESAAFLILSAWSKQNITIIGETGTGKTTLMNSIDLALPSHWRKIYVEDVVESLSQREMGRHQARYRVKTLAESGERGTKTVQSLLSLHRSPDYFILSEILTDEHSRALFRALSSGLRGMETFHSSSVGQALRRWVIHHGIPEDCLSELDLIVFMKKFEGLKPVRRVYGIYEVNDENPMRPVKIFSYDPGKRSLEKTLNLEETETFRRAADFFCVDVSGVLEMYREICSYLGRIIHVEDLREAADALNSAYYEIVFSRWGS